MKIAATATGPTRFFEGHSHANKTVSQKYLIKKNG
jgi:hypothetical protein